MTDTRPVLRQIPAYAQACAAIEGKGLKLRYARSGRAFAVTEHAAPLGSGIGWYGRGEIAILGAHRHRHEELDDVVDCACSCHLPEAA